MCPSDPEISRQASFCRLSSLHCPGSRRAHRQCSTFVCRPTRLFSLSDVHGCLSASFGSSQLIDHGYMPPARCRYCLTLPSAEYPKVKRRTRTRCYYQRLYPTWLLQTLRIELRAA